MWINRITKTTRYGEHEVTLTVRGETGIDHIARPLLMRRIQAAIGKDPNKFSDLDALVTQRLANMILRTETSKGLPFELATVDSDDEKLKESYQQLAQLPGVIADTWFDMLNESNEPPGDPDLRPSKELTEDQKKIQKSNAKEAS